jgi:4-hydroxy-3-methylbut-2-enyl diphosphate reductase
VGDQTSSNSRHLCEVAREAGRTAYLLGSAAELEASWLADATVVGVSAGASTPDDLVAELIQRLCRDGALLEEEVFMEERVGFRPSRVWPHTEPDRPRVA